MGHELTVHGVTVCAVAYRRMGWEIGSIPLHWWKQKGAEGSGRERMRAEESHKREGGGGEEHSLRRSAATKAQFESRRAGGRIDWRMASRRERGIPSRYKGEEGVVGDRGMTGGNWRWRGGVQDIFDSLWLAICLLDCAGAFSSVLFELRSMSVYMYSTVLCFFGPHGVGGFAPLPTH